MNPGAADTTAAAVEITGPIARIAGAVPIMAAVVTMVTMVDVSRIAVGATMAVVGTAASDHRFAVSHGVRCANGSDHRGLTAEKPEGTLILLLPTPLASGKQRTVTWVTAAPVFLPLRF